MTKKEETVKTLELQFRHTLVKKQQIERMADEEFEKLSEDELVSFLAEPVDFSEGLPWLKEEYERNPKTKKDKALKITEERKREVVNNHKSSLKDNSRVVMKWLQVYKMPESAFEVMSDAEFDKFLSEPAVFPTYITFHETPVGYTVFD